VSFLYPRTISVGRVTALRAGGNQGYRSAAQTQETAVLTGLPANIRFRSDGPRPLPGVPADAVGRTMWRILLPGNAAAPGSIHKDDIATDDLGRRFKLMMPDWKSGMGIQIEAELEAA
jgi:hypothetical protein